MLIDEVRECSKCGKCRSVCPVFGAVNDEGVNFAVLTQMDRLEAPNVLVLPVALKNRVVCFLYADNGDGLLSPDAVTEIVPIGYNVATAFQRLILQAPALLDDRTRGADPRDENASVSPSLTRVGNRAERRASRGG